MEFLAGVGARARADQITKFEDHGVGDSVVDAGAFAAALQEAGVEQRGQVAGDIGLAALEGVDDLRDREFAFFEAFEDAQADRFGEGVEAVGDGADHFVTEGSAAGSHRQ